MDRGRHGVAPEGTASTVVAPLEDSASARRSSGRHVFDCGGAPGSLGVGAASLQEAWFRRQHSLSGGPAPTRARLRHAALRSRRALPLGKTDIDASCPPTCGTPFPPLTPHAAAWHRTLAGSGSTSRPTPSSTVFLPPTPRLQRPPPRAQGSEAVVRLSPMRIATSLRLLRKARIAKNPCSMHAAIHSSRHEA